MTAALLARRAELVRELRSINQRLAVPAPAPDSDDWDFDPRTAPERPSTALVDAIDPSQQQRVILEALIDAFPRRVSGEHLIDALYGDRADGGPEDARVVLSIQMTLPLPQKMTATLATPSFTGALPQITENTLASRRLPVTDAQTEARAILKGFEAIDPFVEKLMVDRIATALAAKDVELSVQVEAKEHARRECERAEAQLAEANKALEPFAGVAELVDFETEGFSDDDTFELMFNDYLLDRFTLAHFRAARRAREQGGQNG